MENIDVLSVIFRWMHITGAVIAIGGAVFAAFVLLPAVHPIPAEVRPSFHEAIRKGYARLVMIAIVLLVISGFYNYLRNEVSLHKGQPVYHAIMGVKILLAFIVFILASALTGKSRAFEKIRERRKRYLSINLLLGFIIIALGAILRAIPDVVK
jgi:uncharacterized membrane protein